MTARAPIVRSDELRTANRHRLLAELRLRGACSRSVLGDSTGLSPAAISSFAAELVADGIVDTIRTAGARGRPGSTLQLRADAATAISVSLSIDRLDARLIDYHGVASSHVERALDTRSLDAAGVIDAVLDVIATLVRRQARRTGCGALQHVSVGFQGMVEPATGTLVWSPILSVADVALAAAIEDRFGIGATVHNDCRLIAEALHTDAADRLGANFATVLFSHGVGLALVLNDRPFSGVGSSALELGHLRHAMDGAVCRCGRRGCIEAYCADYAILRHIGTSRGESAAAIDRVADDRIDAAIADALRAEPAATAAFAAAGSAIGSGLAQLFLLLGPMPVALVGRTSAALDVMRPALEQALTDAAPPDAVAPAVDLTAWPDDDALLHRGLALNALASVDRQLALA